MVELKIKELKELAIAYECAQEYDCCPGVKEVDNILRNILTHDKDDLILILKKYCGWSCSDISSATFSKIRLI